MNSSSKQNRLDWEEHGMNCSDPHCVLPVCVNWKLFRQAIARQSGRQICHTRVDTRRKDVNRQRSGPVLGHDTEEWLLQLQRDVQEFERVQSRVESLGTSEPNVNPLQVKWTNGSQQIPQATGHGPMQDMEKPTSWFPKNTLRKYEKGPALKVPPDKSIPNFDLEQFIPIDSYVVAPENKEDMETKCIPNDHAEIPTEFPVGPNAFKETVCSLEESKEQLQGIQSKGTNQIFGILSEILHTLEAPMSAELEAFCVQVLRKAHQEIQTGSRLMSSLTMCTWETQEWDMLYHQ